jgi:hypothetical protein
VQTNYLLHAYRVYLRPFYKLVKLGSAQIYVSHLDKKCHAQLDVSHIDVSQLDSSHLHVSHLDVSQLDVSHKDFLYNFPFRRFTFEAFPPKYFTIYY